MNTTDIIILLPPKEGLRDPQRATWLCPPVQKSVIGPWENSPYNPIVHTYSVTDSWWSKGHGTLIDDVNATGGSFIMRMPMTITRWDAPP